MRYYVSHRLVANSGEPNQGGWRLPAPEVEARVAALIRKTLTHPAAASRFLPQASADTIARIRSTLIEQIDAGPLQNLLKLAAVVTLSPGQLDLQLDAQAVAEMFQTKPESINADALKISTTFQLRKRGVETKLVIADAQASQDETLIRNIAKAHHWFGLIKSGKTFDQIATDEGTSKRRIQQMIDLAFLAPDIIRDLLDGQQPLGFTSDWYKRHGLPTDWAAQRKLLATL